MGYRRSCAALSFLWCSGAWRQFPTAEERIESGPTPTHARAASCRCVGARRCVPWAILAHHCGAWPRGVSSIALPEGRPPDSIERRRIDEDTAARCVSSPSAHGLNASAPARRTGRSRQFRREKDNFVLLSQRRGMDAPKSRLADEPPCRGSLAPDAFLEKSPCRAERQSETSWAHRVPPGPTGRCDAASRPFPINRHCRNDLLPRNSGAKWSLGRMRQDVCARVAGEVNLVRSVAVGLTFRSPQDSAEGSCHAFLRAGSVASAGGPDPALTTPLP